MKIKEEIIYYFCLNCNEMSASSEQKLWSKTYKLDQGLKSNLLLMIEQTLLTYLQKEKNFNHIVNVINYTIKKDIESIIFPQKCFFTFNHFISTL